MQQAADCINSISDFVNDDDDAVDAADVPPLSAQSASTTDNIVYYVAGFVLRHCKKSSDMLQLSGFVNWRWAYSGRPRHYTCAFESLKTTSAAI